MKIKLLMICIFAAAHFYGQHNSTYSQYIFNGLLLNPAYAGSSDALNLTTLYRKQWLGLDGAPTTLTFSGHMPLKKKKVSLGIILMSDKYGVSEHNKASFVYAYRFKLLRGQFSFGIEGGVDVYRANWDQVRTTQLRDPSFAVNQDKKMLPLAGFGMYYYTNNLYLGLSIPNLLGQDFNKYQTSIFNAGCVLNLSENFKIKPAVLVKYILSSPLDLNVTSTFYWKTIIGLGLGYSINGTTLAFLDIRVNDQFRLGYSYDYMISNLQNYNTGSHEIMLRYLFQYKVKVSSTRYF